METMFVNPEALPPSAAGPREATVLSVTTEPGPRGGSWTARDGAGSPAFQVARRPFGGNRMVVRGADGAERASVGERVLSLVETYALWREGRTFARVYRQPKTGPNEHWLVEVGEDDCLLAVTGAAGTLHLRRGGKQVASVAWRDGVADVEVAPGEDAPLVLALASLLRNGAEPLV